eukprot:CAMPEP_0202026542 /NCGR_PEP_ID=MMETSP0905-20130828/59164_1 /ASSEMBLY_ACC=CAM_ASM_000554 /TAXON_ID=420261 /ORGANISM="Thalassiosira antarctica, Strain CCMP982" /LENGTH=1024 /DNA_ID=CAMNT_0048589789 /DNA_START=6 /DNA_END=3076 /DNA_ORIENTATION=+
MSSEEDYASSSNSSGSDDEAPEPAAAKPPTRGSDHDDESEAEEKPADPKQQLFDSGSSDDDAEEKPSAKPVGDSGSDDDDDETEEKPTAKQPSGSGDRGATPRATSSSRRNPRRYTTADIDQEIATNKDGDDDDGSNNSSGDDDSDHSSGQGFGSDDDSEEEETPLSKLKQGAIKSPIRRTGIKQKAKSPVANKPAAKKAAAKKSGKKPSASSKNKKGGKKDDFLADSESDEEDEASSASSPDEEEGEAWDQDASDANDSNGSDSDFGAPSKKRGGKRKAAASEDEDEEESDSDSDFGAPRKKRGAKKKVNAKTTKARDEEESSDSDFGAPRKKRAAKKKTTKARATPTRARATRSTYQSSPSSSEAPIQYETTPSGTRRPLRQCKSRTEEKMHSMVKADMQSEKEALRGVLEEDDRELLENSDAANGSDGGGSDGEEYVKDVAKGRGKSKATTPKKRGNKYDDDEDYGAPSDTNNDSDDDDDDDAMSDFEESDDGISNQRRTNSRTNTRTSSRKKSSKNASYKDVDEDSSDIGTADEDSNDEATGPSLLMSPARKSSSAVGNYGSPSSRQRARARMGRTPLDVHEQDGSSEESDGRSKKKKKKSKPKKKRRKLSAGSDDEESDYSEHSKASEGSNESSGGDNGKSIKNPYNSKRKSPTPLQCTHINCPSTIDDITMTNLPKNKPHVCYVAPDGKTRRCFTLDTLYRIAISSSGTYNNNTETLTAVLHGGSAKLKFLQPPHFRSEMEDDLLDQIASRFGRGALVIESSAVYKKMRGRGGRFTTSGLDEELDEFDEDGEYIGYSEMGVPTHNFQDRFERYMQNLMGSMDVYCCPLCYNESDRRLGTNGDEEMWEDDETSPDDADGEDNATNGKEEAAEDRFSFLDDPLTILGSLDSDKFEVASSFCFRLLSGLKTHLKVVHGINVSSVAGNDLFKRFQIRASDGLLQSWLRKSLRQNTVQGDMMRYWLNGENQSFVLLLSQMDLMRKRGEQGGETGSDFSVSFPNRAKRIWRDVSAPYLKQMDMG